MKSFSSIIIIMLSLFWTTVNGQNINWQKTSNWKIYKIQDNRSFIYTLDTLQNFTSIRVNDKEMQLLVQGIADLNQKESPLWMGNYVLSFDYPNGVSHKIEVSTYGGFLYEDAAKKYYFVPENNRRQLQDFMSKIFGQFEITK